MNVKILPYKTGSRSAKALSAALSVKQLKLSGSKWKPKVDSVVINWGNSGFYDEFEGCLMLNGPELICQVKNKLDFFKNMSGNEWLPPFWTNKEDIPDEAFPIVCRTILTGHSGAGIVVADTRDDVVDCQLYVKYIKKMKEFRIHVGHDNIISEQQKVAKKGQEPLDWKIRSHQNGFIYQRQGIDVPMACRGSALACLAKTGLDFGAVDVIYTKDERVYVLEINTAPGLEGQTVLDYKAFFEEIIP